MFFIGSGAGIRTQDPPVTPYPNISIGDGLYHHPASGGVRGASRDLFDPSTLLRDSLWTFPALAGLGCWLPYPESGFRVPAIHLVFPFPIAWEGCNNPAWISLWQLEQISKHLFNSVLVFSQERVRPLAPSPKSFFLGLRWWNSRAPAHRL